MNMPPVSRRSFLQSVIACSGFVTGCRPRVLPHQPAQYRAHLVDLSETSTETLRFLKRDRAATAVIATLDERASSAQVADFEKAARNMDLQHGFWIEVGRNEEMARARPDWLHTPQHSDWLRSFPEWEGRNPAVFPWLPLNNKSVFDFQLERISQLALSLRPGDSVFLNNVQNPPAGCGCGNLQCRSWDNSPGQKIAPSPYEHKDVYFTDLFVSEVERKHPKLKIIPVICPECERGVRVGSVESPDLQTGYCNTIDCSDPCARYYYPGLIRSLARLERVGLLCTYKALDRDLDLYGGAAAWVAANIERYLHNSPSNNIIAVLQGWDVDETEIKTQIDRARSAGVLNYLISSVPLDQSFRPVSV